MDFFTNKARISKSAYTRDRVNPITGGRIDVDMPESGQKPGQEDNKTPALPIYEATSRKENNRGENIDFLLPMKHYKRDDIKPKDFEFNDDTKPIPDDDKLTNVSLLEITSKVNKYDDNLPLEERLARINLQSLRPKQPLPSPRRQEQMTSTPRSHVLDTPWDIVPDHIVHEKKHSNRISPEEIQVAAGMTSKKLANKRVVAMVSEINGLSSIKKHENNITDMRNTNNQIIDIHRAWINTNSNNLMMQQKRAIETKKIEKIKNMTETIIMDLALNSHKKINVIPKPPMNKDRDESFKNVQRSLYDTHTFDHDNTSRDLLEKNMVFFQARMLSLNGKFSIKDIAGFYFINDDSLAIFEHKQFNGGQNSSMLPFISRARYSHCFGTRRGEPYAITDICVGKTISFMTHDQPLSMGIKHELDYITLVINYVDETVKQNTLLKSVDEIEKCEVWSRIHFNEKDYKKSVMQSDVKSIVRDQVGAVTIDFYMGFGRMLRNLTNNTSNINIRDCEELFKLFGITLANSKLATLWAQIDDQKTKTMDAMLFKRHFIAEMPEECMSTVKRAFKRMDINHNGNMNIAELQKFFLAYKNPLVLSGDMEADTVTKAFQIIFQKTSIRNEVNFCEFEDFYQGLYQQLGVESSVFTSIIENAYQL